MHCFSGVAKQLNPAIDILLMASPYIFRSYLNVNSNDGSTMGHVATLTEHIQDYLILS